MRIYCILFWSIISEFRDSFIDYIITGKIRDLINLEVVVFNLLRWNDVPRTSRNFCPKIAIFSQFKEYLSITRTKQIINLLLLNNFYPVISYRRVPKESDELLYTVWSLVMVRNQLPAQVVNTRTALKWKKWCKKIYNMR